MTKPEQTNDTERIAESIPILSAPLNDEQRKLLVEYTAVEYPYKGETIYQEGDEAEWLFYLIEGSATLFKANDHGPNQIFRMVSPKSIFGYRDAFNNEPCSHTAVAGENTVIAKVPMSTVFHLIWENSGFAMVFIKDLSELLGLSLRTTAILTKKHIRGRLAECILRMKEKYGLEADGTLPIYLSRQSLAGMTNMTTSNAIRTLSAFIDEGLVAIVDRRIRILDEDGLRRASKLS